VNPIGALFSEEDGGMRGRSGNIGVDSAMVSSIARYCGAQTGAIAKSESTTVESREEMEEIFAGGGNANSETNAEEGDAASLWPVWPFSRGGSKISVPQ